LQKFGWFSQIFTPALRLQ